MHICTALKDIQSSVVVVSIGTNKTKYLWSLVCIRDTPPPAAYGTHLHLLLINTVV